MSITSNVLPLPIRIKTSDNTWSNVANVKIKTTSNTWSNVKAIWVKDTVTCDWKQVYG